MVNFLPSIPFVKLDLAFPGVVESWGDYKVEVLEILSRDERVSWEVRDQEGDTEVREDRLWTVDCGRSGGR